MRCSDSYRSSAWTGQKIIRTVIADSATTFSSPQFVFLKQISFIAEQILITVNRQTIKTALLNQSLLPYKNFWFFLFCCILALETVESSYLIYSQPVFFKSHFINKIENKHWVISISKQ